MALFLTFPDGEPNEFSLAYNDNPWVVKTTINTPTVRIRVEVLPPDFPISPIIAQVRIYPIPADNGVNYQTSFFDPSRSLQSFVNGQVRIEGADHNAFFTVNEIHKEYRLLMQEEFLNANGVYENGQLIITDVKSVWNGVRDDIEWVDFDVSDYIMNGTSTTRKFLTDSPRTIRIDSNQSHTLYFICNERFSAYQYNIKAYSGENATGSLLADATVSNNINVADTFSEVYFRIPVGTYDMSNIDSSLMTGSTPSTVLNGAKSYTIQLEDNTNAATSEMFTFNVDPTCTKYEPVRLHWLNRLGGFDSFNFYLKSEEEIDINRESYHKQQRQFTGFAYNYDKSARGMVDYDVSIPKRLKVNTDYLTEDESAWMEDFVTSPTVYREVNNELISMNITNRRYKKQTSLNDKLMHYEFELDFSIPNRRQRG